MQPPIAEAAAFLGERLQALAKAGLVSPGSTDISWSSGSRRWLYTPAVRSSRMPLADGRQPSAFPRASPLLSQEILQRRIVQHDVRQQPFQLRVLVFQRPQPLGL
jgi:hypothetical protein